MTYPPTSPPPSAGCSWELLTGIEAGVANTKAAGRYRELLLCRVVRELCAERDARLDEAAQLLAAVTVRDAQLSAYVTAAEGRPASELVAPSEVAKIIEERREWHELWKSKCAVVGALDAKLAERDAEIARLRKRIWPNGEGG